MYTMFCSVCINHRKPLPQACGAWVTHPVKKWGKATELLAKHHWHLAAVEAQASSESAKQHGDVIDGLLS